MSNPSFEMACLTNGDRHIIAAQGDGYAVRDTKTGGRIAIGFHGHDLDIGEVQMEVILSPEDAKYLWVCLGRVASPGDAV